MLFTLFVGVIAFTLIYVWLVMHRQRVMAMEDRSTTGPRRRAGGAARRGRPRCAKAEEGRA